MGTLCEAACGTFILLLWLTGVFEAFDGLSGGRIRKVEAKDEALAERLDNWMEQGAVLRLVLKLLLFMVSALIGGLLYQLIGQLIPALAGKHIWNVVIMLVAMLVCCGAAELVAGFILMRYDLILLRISIPLLLFLSSTVFLPFTILVKNKNRKSEIRQKNEEDEDDKAVSVEDEILSFVESYNDDSENDLEEGEKRMIRGILDLSDKSVHEIMTPRVDLDALPENASVYEAKQLFISTGHSRIPVYRKSIDEIIGIVYAKDFLNENELAGKSLMQLAHAPIFIPETKEVGELLNEIKNTHNHFAVIIDEYGGTSGVVTFEDIIEEIVGDVRDEYDTEEDAEIKPQLMADGSIVLEARTLLADIVELAGIDVPEDDAADTVGGYICSQLGRIPETHELYRISETMNAVILEADERKIEKIRLEFAGEGKEE